VISLEKLGEQVHLSREVCCRLFRKMTGKTVTQYLEEYRASKSLPLVESGQYSMTQIADLVGFSNASRFAAAFRQQFGCNPGEYNSRKRQEGR
jgi:AraC-like DNA-binding protein